MVISKSRLACAVALLLGCVNMTGATDLHVERTDARSTGRPSARTRSVDVSWGNGWRTLRNFDAAAPRQQTDLARELNRIAASTSGTLGVRVLHVESGTGAGVNAGDWFPMMSVYKLPIVIHALRQAETGKLDLSRSIRLRS